MSTTWFIVAGALLISMALAGSALRRAPLTASMFYLAVGAALGPWGAGLLHVNAVEDASIVERLTEIAVIISLFTAGLKLRLPGSDQRWRAPILLAVLAMLLTIGGIAAFAVAALGLPMGAAVLLGALLAPTDPVLASDVQVSHEHAMSRPQRAFIAWFGVRGVGSIYYLAYALSHGVPGPAGRMLADVTLVVVAGSVVLHGISVTPLMQRYSAFIGERQRQ